MGAISIDVRQALRRADALANAPTTASSGRERLHRPTVTSHGSPGTERPRACDAIGRRKELSLRGSPRLGSAVGFGSLNVRACCGMRGSNRREGGLSTEPPFVGETCEEGNQQL